MSETRRARGHAKGVGVLVRRTLRARSTVWAVEAQTAPTVRLRVDPPICSRAVLSRQAIATGQRRQLISVSHPCGPVDRDP
jgi:hypothetical protein